jgi:alpha-ketoglutarate-dependent taurine dioxygenase
MAAITFRPLTPSFGAEVIGVPPSLEMDDVAFAAVEAAWFRHGILLFRGLEMTPEQHIAFTRRLGPLHIMHPLDFNLPGHPEVLVIGNAREGGKPIGLPRAGMGFHSDGEDKAIPNAGSFLYGVQVPDEEGDTLFADMFGAWEALPEALKRKVAGRRACYSRLRLHHVHYPHLPALTEAQIRDRPDVWHPIARRHPVTGRTSLFIGRWACEVEGMEQAEGEALIAELIAFSQQQRFLYRHHWLKGDAILWDNRCTQHCATPFDEARYTRRMQRTTLEGSVPILAEVA